MLKKRLRRIFLLNIPLIHKKHAAGNLACKPHFMCDNHHGHAFFSRLLDDIQHLAHHFGVQRTGGFVKQHHVRLHGQSARNGHARLLAGGKLCWVCARLFRKANTGQQLLRALARFFFREPFCIHRPCRYIVQHGHVGKQVELLEHHAYLLAHGVYIYPRCGNISPFKQHTAAPAALRLEMCGCFRQLAQGEEAVTPQLEVSSWEIAQAEAGRRNYTVLTVEMLAAQDPEGELYLAVGSDMLLSFDGWHRWQDILRLAHLVVTSRNAGDAPELCAKARQLDPAGQRILFAPVTALPMASSALRQRLAAGEDCAEELPEAVRAVIRREHLYQT